MNLRETMLTAASTARLLVLAIGVAACGSGAGANEPRRVVGAASAPPVDPLVALEMPPIGPPRFPTAAPASTTPPAPQPAEASASAEPSAAPTAVVLPPVVKPTTPPIATFAYHETFTGMMPGRTVRWSWALELYAGNVAIVDREKWVGPQTSLEVVPSFPLPSGTFTRESQDRFGARWAGNASTTLTLTLATDEAHPLTCAAKSVEVMPTSARILRVEVKDEWRSTWAFKGARTRSSALECARGALAEEAIWSVEPQPAGLLFSATPGVEYAHESSGDSMQIGGLRAWVEP